MNRAQKKAEIEFLNQTLQDNDLVVVTHYRGLTVEQMTNLREKARENGAQIKVTKNTLAKLALKGTDYEGLADLFNGPTAMAYSKDPIAAAKVTIEFAKDNDNLVVIGGSYGDKFLDEAAVKALAAMPSLDELRGKIVGMLATPATRIATVAQAPASQVARVIGAYANKG